MPLPDPDDFALKRTALLASFEADRRLTAVEVLLGEHLKQCQKQTAMLAKLAWLGLTANLVILGTLLKIVLHL